MREFICPKVTAALAMLGPRAGGTFPSRATDLSILRFVDAETPKQWFIRIASDVINPEETLLHERIALVGHTSWSKDSLRSVNLQALCVTHKALSDVYADPESISDADCHYFRLDIHPHALGYMFREPIVHVHSNGHEEPRFPFQSRNSKSLLPDFITFLFQNYAYDVWEEWVLNVWKTHTHFLPHQDPIDRIREAFKDSQIIQLLNTYQNDLRTLRNLIHAEIDAAANEFLPVPENTELLRL